MATSNAETTLTSLRESMKAIITTTLNKIVENAWKYSSNTSIEAYAVKLERAVYNNSVKEIRQNPKIVHRQFYAETVWIINSSLDAQIGTFPDDILGLMYLNNSLTATDTVLTSLKGISQPDPREIMRRMFTRVLMDALEEYMLNRTLALETARDIEVSCYNASVRISKESEDPPRRQWDSLPFIDIYGTRCGTISVLLDPLSTACQAYGATLAPHILDGTIALSEIGNMTAKELCPQSSALEQAEINKRVIQKVQMKESSLFKCPNCNARRCTYQEVQRRSLDEAPDYLCLCLSCNRRFTGRS
jgi:DNA-directed RNA polymerase subunit M/transcription elongation factor TFIIS